MCYGMGCPHENYMGECTDSKMRCPKEDDDEDVININEEK